MANIELQQAFKRDKLKEAFDFFDIVILTLLFSKSRIRMATFRLMN
jgi:hypothetical protein